MNNSGSILTRNNSENREKGICIRHKALGRYSSGNKRCKYCDLFIMCCGYKLRTNPRKYNLKEKLREQRSVEESKKIRILYYIELSEEEISERYLSRPSVFNIL
jgi:hypothetical protein